MALYLPASVNTSIAKMKKPFLIADGGKNLSKAGMIL
jgi:hypothetical protein